MLLTTIAVILAIAPVNLEAGWGRIFRQCRGQQPRFVESGYAPQCGNQQQIVITRDASNQLAKATLSGFKNVNHIEVQEYNHPLSPPLPNPVTVFKSNGGNTQVEITINFASRPVGPDTYYTFIISGEGTIGFHATGVTSSGSTAFDFPYEGSSPHEFSSK